MKFIKLFESFEESGQSVVKKLKNLPNDFFTPITTSNLDDEDNSENIRQRIDEQIEIILKEISSKKTLEEVKTKVANTNLFKYGYGEKDFYLTLRAASTKGLFSVQQGLRDWLIEYVFDDEA